MHIPTAEKILKEAKSILDELDITFCIHTGTCLGAIRGGAIITYDYDVDIASVFGLHGLTEEVMQKGIDAFKAHGFSVTPKHHNVGTVVVTKKENIILDWTCYKEKEDGIRVLVLKETIIPVELFHQLKEIDFLGEKFFVPNPPEEYLERTYGTDWRIPIK